MCYSNSAWRKTSVLNKVSGVPFNMTRDLTVLYKSLLCTLEPVSFALQSNMNNSTFYDNIPTSITEARPVL